MKVISISHKTFSLHDSEILSNLNLADQFFEYRFSPVIITNCGKYEQYDGFSYEEYVPECKYFTLYEAGVSFSRLKRFFGKKLKMDRFNFAKKAITHLRNLSTPFADRVVADTCCQIILKECNQENNNEDILFLIERLPSDKMLGRLSYLYLPDNVTIFFIAYNTYDLLTTVISARSGKLHFDLSHLLSRSNSSNIISLGPYPNSIEDALEHTFFMVTEKKEDTFAGVTPIRVDIFSQGLTMERVRNKFEQFQNFYKEGYILPLRLDHTYSVDLPNTFTDLIKKWEGFDQSRKKNILFPDGE